MTRIFRVRFAEAILCVGLCSVLIALGTRKAHAQSADIPDEITMYAGQAQVQSAPGPLKRIAVGDGKLLEVKTIGKQEMVLIAEKPGDTSMQLWMSDGSQRSVTVHVTAGNSEQ